MVWGWTHRTLWVSLSVFALSGCAHVRPAPRTAACELPASALSVEDNDRRGPAGALSASSSRRTFQDVLNGVLMLRPGEAVGPSQLPSPGPVQTPAVRQSGRREMLVISGGGEDGAFGGGFFNGLKSVPTYDIVTGVSTGALLSTMVFLANDPLGEGRTYPRQKPGARFTPKRSNLEDLGVALSITSEEELLDVGRSQVLDGLTKGAVGSLEPLRNRLLGFVSEDTLQKIKKAYQSDRRLFVGVTDLDDGAGYAIDLTELASRVDTPDWRGRTNELRGCYVDALIASSSVPLAAFPTTLNISVASKTPNGPAEMKTDLFVDGGVRFGVFLPQIDDKLDSNRFAQTSISVLVNGRLYSKPWVIKGSRPTDWDPINLVKRTVSILVNQIYRFSVNDVANFPGSGGNINLAYISNTGLAQLRELPDEHEYKGMTCEKWKDEDVRLNSPVEFHPRYMACLLDYGVSRGKQDPWNETRRFPVNNSRAPIVR
jgi:hypothetical protein